MTNEREVAINWSEEGGGLAVNTGYGWCLYQVPQYGGEPIFSAHFKTLDEAIAVAEKWT